MKVIEVQNLKHVDVTRYKDGDLFVSKTKKAILHQGKLDPLVTESDLKGYVKKKDVEKMIEKALEKGGSK